MIPVLLAFILLMPLTASGQAGGNWLTYENEDLGFSIQYPPDWTIEEEGGGDLVNLRSNDDETLHVEITSESLPDEGTTLEEYSDMRINDLEEDSEDFKLSRSSSTTLGLEDYPARKVVYKLRAEGNDQTVTRFWTIKDDKAYSIAYIGVEPKYFNLYSIGLKMIDSFQMKK